MAALSFHRRMTIAAWLFWDFQACNKTVDETVRHHCRYFKGMDHVFLAFSGSRRSRYGFYLPSAV